MNKNEIVWIVSNKYLCIYRSNLFFKKFSYGERFKLIVCNELDFVE